MAKLHTWEIRRLRPTQITVGMIEVEDRRRELDACKPRRQRDFLAAHPMPAVFGPEGRLYITDHHHLARAAWELGIDEALFLAEADLSTLAGADFWRTMFDRHWAHPYDEHGVLRPYHEIPHHLGGLRDDIYRSLACYVRHAGGYDKTPTAFAEFRWADYFRRRVTIGPGAAGFQEAVGRAVALAHRAEARDLPGFRPASAGG